MTKATTNGKAARALAKGALAPRPGAAQPPLDLSLGHIGTTGEGNDRDVEVLDFGAFRLVLNLKTGASQLFTDASAFANRAERRAAEKQFWRAANRVSRKSGFAVEKVGAP